MLHPRFFVAAVALAGVAAGAGCTRGERTGSATSLAASGTPASSDRDRGRDAPTAAPRETSTIDFLAPSDTCTFGHRGVLLDLGDPMTVARMSGGKLALPDVDIREREGASWVGVRARSFEISFVSSTELKSDAGIVVEARVRGGLAKSASVYLNGKPVGSLPLAKGVTTVVSVRSSGSSGTSAGSIARGANELLLRFNGGPRASHDQLAEIDWIRVGPNDGDAPYSAPTRDDAITTVNVGGTSRRAVSLRAPGFARCAAFLPNGSVLEGSIAGVGGEAEAEVRVLVDRGEPRVVGSFHVGGPTDPKGWRPISLPLGDIGTIAAVELVAKSSSKGARVVFGEARVVSPSSSSSSSSSSSPSSPAGAAASATATPDAPPPAKGVVLVVLGSTSRRMLSLYGGAIPMPELAALAKGGAVYEAHRATSSFASGALGSMLTGLSPRQHGASDGELSLSPAAVSVAEAVRQAGIVTAMFTANPSTSEPYGFSRGWETFVSRLPGSEDVPAASIFDDVGRWIEEHKGDRFFVVVHARGGHPPWDVTSEELKDLPPAGYQGSLEPKHAGEALAKARKAGGGRMFADPDRERAFALHAKALTTHDAALGGLVSRVRAAHRDQDTAWIVTGDIGIDAAARVPFLEEESLEEGGLAIPLVIRAPTELGGAARIATATSGADIAPTILEAFGLPPPPHLRGESLWRIAKTPKAAGERPLIAATTTRFSARWGQFAVVGSRDREVKVCDLSLDVDCVTDVRPSHPVAAEALHALAWRELVTRPARPDEKPQGPTPVVADGITSAALKTWGR